MLVVIGLIIALRRSRASARWLIPCFILTSGLFILISIFKPLANPRNIMIMTPFIAILAGLAVSRLPKPVRAALGLGLLAAWLALMPGLSSYHSADQRWFLVEPSRLHGKDSGLDPETRELFKRQGFLIKKRIIVPGIHVT